MVEASLAEGTMVVAETAAAVRAVAETAVEAKDVGWALAVSLVADAVPLHAHADVM